MNTFKINGLTEKELSNSERIMEIQKSANDLYSLYKSKIPQIESEKDKLEFKFEGMNIVFDSESELSDELRKKISLF